MSEKDNGREREPLLRLQVTVPRWLGWMVVGALLGRIDDVGTWLDFAVRLLQ